MEKLFLIVLVLFSMNFISCQKTVLESDPVKEKTSLVSDSTKWINIKGGAVGNSAKTDSLIKVWDAAHADPTKATTQSLVVVPITYICTTTKAPESKEFPMDNGSFVDGQIAREWFYSKYGQPEIISVVDKSEEELNAYCLANMDTNFPIAKDSVIINSNGSLGKYFLIYYHQLAIRTTYKAK